MTRRRTAVGMVVATVAATGAAAGVTVLVTTASAASAPVISVSHGCYQTAERGTLHGRGFDASSHWSAKLNGKPFGTGTTTASGTITASFGAPNHLLKGSTGEDSYRLVVTEGKHSATTTFLVTRLSASFAPTSGDLATLKVRFHLLGWGKGTKAYLHYVTPKGKTRLDRSLGATTGACGDLTTSPLKLFPFRPIKGKWTLQFDTQAKYEATAVPRVAIGYKIT